MTAPPVIDHFGPLADAYTGFIFDLWGVVHNGVAPFPGVPEALRTLRRQGRPVVFLSTAPRRAAAVAGRLDALGVTRDLYDAVLSSGEVTFHELTTRADPAFAALGARARVIGLPDDRSVAEDVPGLTVVRDTADADFLLNIGPPPDPGVTVADYADLLADSAARGLPMVCANPDVEVRVGGDLVICAGALAARYEALGGRVIRRGKPDPAVYDACLARMGEAGHGRVLVVGDALPTDVRGAKAAGLDALLVAGGIHAERFLDATGAVRPEAVAAACAEEGLDPVAVTDAVRW